MYFFKRKFTISAVSVFSLVALLGFATGSVYPLTTHNSGVGKSLIQSGVSQLRKSYSNSTNLGFEYSHANNKNFFPLASTNVNLTTEATLTAKDKLQGSGVQALVLELKPRNVSLLNQYASQVDIKGSPYYHKYLSSQQIMTEFAPTQNTISVIESILLQHGLGIGSLPANKLLIPFYATKKQESTYFATGSAGFLGAHFQSEKTGRAGKSSDLIVNSLGLPSFLRPYAIGVLKQNSTSPAARLQHASLVVTKKAEVGVSSADQSGKSYGNNWLSSSAFGEQSKSLLSKSIQKAGRADLFKFGTHSTSSLENPIFSNPLSPHACSAALSDAGKTKAWTINAIANAYGLGPLYDQGDLGQGETIAVFELEPFLRSDLAAFEQCYFGHSFLDNITRVKVDGFSLQGAGSGEAILDMELLSALAPEAHLLIYESPNTAAGVLEAYNDMVIQDKANIATTSWGECEAALQASAPGAEQLENFIFEEGAIEGISLFAATGDDGADDCASTPYGSNTKEAPYLSVDDPASQPFVVGVGGNTMLAATNPPLQAVWNNGPAGGGGGGGLSTVWSQPAWQSSLSLQGNQGNSNRELPDISMTANEDYGVTVFSRTAYGFGYIKTKKKVFLHPNVVVRHSAKYQNKSKVIQTSHVVVMRHHISVLPGGWTSVGGTSEAAPIMAASMALVASSAACNGLPVTQGGPDIGFLSPLLYQLASNPATYAQSFDQVTSGNNDVFHDGKGYQAGPGYNLVTGLGSVILTNSGGSPAFDANVCALALGKQSTVSGSSGNVTVASVTPGEGSVTGNETVSIDGNGFGTLPNDLSVYFGDVKAKIISAANNQITVLTPPSPVYTSSAPFAGAGEVAVTVTKLVSQSMSVSAENKASVYNYVDFAKLQSTSSGILNTRVKPVVTYLAPTGGRESGGTKVTVFGNGFTKGGGVREVLFGGRKARSFRVVSDRELIAVTPAMTGRTKCRKGRGFIPATVCQTDVQVVDAGGKSPFSRILPPVVGNIVLAPGGYDKVVKGREVTPATTEFDYAEPPTIKRVLVSDQVDTSNIPLTITGKNFNVLTLEWVNVGNPKVAANEQTKFEYITGNLVIVITSVLPNSVVSSPGSKEISIQAVTGMSNPAALTQVNGN